MLCLPFAMQSLTKLKSDSDFEKHRTLFLERVQSTEIRAPQGSTLVITEVVEISEVKRSDKKYSASLFGSTFFGNEKRWKSRFEALYFVRS